MAVIGEYEVEAVRVEYHHGTKEVVLWAKDGDTWTEDGRVLLGEFLDELGINVGMCAEAIDAYANEPAG